MSCLRRPHDQSSTLSNPAPSRRSITSVPRPDTGAHRHEHPDQITTPAQTRRSPVNDRLWPNTPQQRHPQRKPTPVRDRQPAPSPPKTDRKQDDDPRSGVKYAASNSDKTRRKHPFPIDLRQAAPQLHPAISYLGASPTLGPRKARLFADDWRPRNLHRHCHQEARSGWRHSDACLPRRRWPESAMPFRGILASRIMPIIAGPMRRCARDH